MENSAPNSESLEIFLIEDCDLDIQLISKAFSSVAQNVNLSVSLDGEEALAKLLQGSYKPDLIILDLNIPKVDGFEFLQEIKKVTSLNNIPIVVLTCSKSKDDFERTYELGANCYISKPQSLDEYRFIAKSIQNFWNSLYQPNQPKQDIGKNEYSLLIIEDHEVTAELISTILSRENTYGNYKYKIEKTLKSGLLQLALRPFDAVILDLNLPDAGHLTALQAISKSYPKIPIIVLTSDVRDNLPLECFTNNADEFISKSDLNVRSLGKTLKFAITRKEMGIKLAEQKLQASIEQARIESISRNNIKLVHEIRSPLSLITIRSDEILDAINEDSLPKSDVMNAIKSIDESVQKINEIIRYSLVHSNDYSQEQASLINVNELARKVLKASEYSIMKHQVNCEFIEDPANSLVNVREGQITQAMINIITNGCKAVENQEDKWIKIQVRTLKDQAIISFTDSGGGIDDISSSKIFDYLFTTNKLDFGTGLGLPIAKSIVEANGGQLSFNKQSANTQFVISLPRYKLSIKEDKAC